MIDVEAPDHNQVLGAGWVMVKGCFLDKKKKKNSACKKPRAKRMLLELPMVSPAGT